MKKYMICFCLFLLVAAPSSVIARGGFGGAFLGGALLGGLTGTAISKSRQPEVVYVQQQAPVSDDQYTDEPDDNDYYYSESEPSDNNLITYYENIEDPYVDTDELQSDDDDTYEYIYVEDEN